MSGSEYQTIKCFRCKGPYHPSTGDWDKKWEIAFCGPCIKYFYDWFKGHSKRKWGKLRFYDEAMTSTIAGGRKY